MLKAEKLLHVEVKEARTNLYSLVQQHHLAEFQLIRKGNFVPRNCNFLSLSPFFDDETNIICVRGRLANSPYEMDNMFLVLVPKKSPINKLLIREAHERSFHSGAHIILLTLRQLLWIPGRFALAKQVIYNCKLCILKDPRLLQPEMGYLPLEKVVVCFSLSATQDSIFTSKLFTLTKKLQKFQLFHHRLLMVHYSSKSATFRRVMGSGSEIVETTFLPNSWKNATTISSVLTVLTQIEAIFNLKSLVTPSNVVNDGLASMPGHFQIKRPLTVLPKLTRDTKISLS